MFFLNIKCSIAADKEYLMIKKSALASYYSLIEKHNYIYIYFFNKNKIIVPPTLSALLTIQIFKKL